LPQRTTAALWCLLGTAAVLGALSGDAVRLLGIRRAWGVTATLTATGTALLALAPGQVLTAAIAGAVFGGAYTALSGVLIAWASALRPYAAGQATATLFIALTAGQAVGSPQFVAVLQKARDRLPVGRPRTRPDAVAADKVYSSRANRSYLRKRNIQAGIPEKKDQAANRKKTGSRGGRLPRHDAGLHTERNTVERLINKLKAW